MHQNLSKVRSRGGDDQYGRKIKRSRRESCQLQNAHLEKSLAEQSATSNGSVENFILWISEEKELSLNGDIFPES